MGRYYKSLIVVMIVALTLVGMWLDRTSITPAPEIAPPALSGQRAPDVTFTLLDGGTIRLHSLAGHRVLLHFWASWCAPCHEEFGLLLARLAKGKDDTVLLAVSGDAKAEDARRFLAPYRHQFASLFDQRKVIVAQDPHHVLIEGVFQTFRYPETIIIAPDLSLKQKVAGPMQEGQ